MSALQEILLNLRGNAKTEREKGTYFEDLSMLYFEHEPKYKSLYSDVWTYAQWAESQGLDQQDAGIDLVAKTKGTDEYHAIQCKFYAEDYTVQKSDIDSFFTASGKKSFSQRIIILTTNKLSKNVQNAFSDQNPPVSTINLHDLEQSAIDWSQYTPKKPVILKQKFELREHQQNAHKAVVDALQTVDRGKLIMACGTGKTFTSLKLAETIAGKGKKVLFLVPSLSLLSQTLTEWTQQSTTPLKSFAVCSDANVGKKKSKNADTVELIAHELGYPATTEAKKLAHEVSKAHDDDSMTVVFSTYHSIDVISKAQNQHGLDEFDFILCDEAHRTTGATFGGEDESAFVKVHDQAIVKGKKRLYMTATPRIYGDAAKIKAESGEAVLCSMDDESLYGKELFVINFAEAVEREILVDYKVIVLTVEETHVSDRLQNLLSDENNQLKVDDAAKIVGCWKALSKMDIEDDLVDDNRIMKRAVAFCQVIEKSAGRTHKVSSKEITNMFQEVISQYKQTEHPNETGLLNCETNHIDGSMNATEKEQKIQWLKSQTDDNTCRILSNVRCLSEGVDVPSLDAVLFLTPRNSQVDVVQSVGRVMRKAEGKKRGYVILPVVIPAGMTPSEALNNNQTYKVVWQVLQALRSHDDRLDAEINKFDIQEQGLNRINVVAVNSKSKMEVVSTVEEINPKYKTDKTRSGASGSISIGNDDNLAPVGFQQSLAFEVSNLERGIKATLVKKCGNRFHWEDWANDIAKIAQTHITRLTSILNNKDNTQERQYFDAFAIELRDDLNSAITDEEIIEMLSQHLITQPVFDALFEDFNFAKQNPISKAMQTLLNQLQQHHLDKETDTLESFYRSVKLRAQGIDNAQGKQKIIVELYDKFFRNAFPKMTERLGIVYTPVEVVDFIIHSINDVLKNEFNQTLGSKNVHIIDPFTGTGTFITRLLQSGLITKDELEHKYKNELHANEIVLLAYYIAAINIESTYHDIMGANTYQPFEGICLTDTFQMYEKADMVDELLVENSARRKKQQALDITVIMGNPPYSAGQKSANDDAQNVAYPTLDASIRDSYAEYSNATNKNALYDSYIRAIRWASDRIKDAGVISFVSGNGYIDKPVTAGIRKCLVDEFSNIHVINLRGDIRKNMLSKGRAKEGQNIFGSGSMTGIALCILVKNPQSASHGNVYYHDIGDDLKTQEKLQRLIDTQSLNGLSEASSWQAITPDKYNDWINQRDDSFYDHIPLGNKKDKTRAALFENYSGGVKTNRDAWVYNASKYQLAKQISQSIDYYNSEVQRYINTGNGVKAEEFVSFDASKFHWGRPNKWDLEKKKTYQFEKNVICNSLYRPFTKTHLYFHRQLNEMIYQMPRIFSKAGLDNVVICMSGIGARSGFSFLISNTLPDVQFADNGQCFPLKLYEPIEESDDKSIQADGNGDLFAANASDEKGVATADDGTQYRVKDGITDAGFAHFVDYYQDNKITKEDVFYYVYGLLHSEDYKTRFADNLSKALPHIPRVKTVKDFWAFSKAGRDLAKLHIDYETVDKYPVTFDYGKHDASELNDAHYRVEKMEHSKVKNDEGKSVNDKTTVIYNASITVKDIPLEAYDYVVNGKPAIDWVIDRQCVKTDKKTGITNDANDWAIETMNNAKYPLELLQRVITVSLETMKVVNALPQLDI